MKTRKMALILALALAAGSALAQATSNPPIYTPVLLGTTYSAATNDVSIPIQAKPTGGVSTVQTLVFAAHDFSRNRFGSGRYFLRTEQVVRTGDTLGSYDESGTQRTVLNNPNDLFTFWRARWSHDGTRIAWCGGRYDPLNPNTLTESGIYVADVLLDIAGNPASLANARRIVEPQPAQNFLSNPAHVSWTGDQQYVIYLVGEGGGYSVYRAEADSVAPGSGQKINLGNISLPYSPKASPVAGDGRIAFIADGPQSREIWTVDVPASYNPATDVLTARQITNKAYVLSWFYYDWSPDAGQFAFTWAPFNQYKRVMKIPSTGGTAGTVLSAKNVNYTVIMWRN